MKKSRFTEVQIVNMVRESQAHGVPEISKKYKISEQTIYQSTDEAKHESEKLD